MNIAVFTDTFTPMRDGIVTAMTGTIKGLADRGYKIYVIAPYHKNFKEFSYPNVTVKRVRGVPALFYPGFKFTSFISLEVIRYLKKREIDIIHFQTPFTIGIQAILTAKILHKPLVGTFHTFVTDEMYLKHAGINPKFLRKLAYSYVRGFYNKCNLITCPSESTRKELKDNNFFKPMKVISNGIDLKSFENLNREKIKEEYKLNNKTILFIGRIAYEKNIKYLLKCFKIVLKKIPDAKLLIVGGGPQMEEIQNFSDMLNISKNVIFTGKIEHRVLIKSEIFKTCKIFVTASTTENQPITLLEAQANGLVCVGMNVRGIKDLIKNNYSGYLVRKDNKNEFAKKIIALLKSKELLNKMSKNTLKEIKKHDISLVVQEWEKNYKNLIIKMKKVKHKV